MFQQKSMWPGVPLPLPAPEIPDKGKGKCKLWKAHTKGLLPEICEGDLLASQGLVGTWKLVAQALQNQALQAQALWAGAPGHGRSGLSRAGLPLGPSKAPALTSKTLAGRVSKQAGLTWVLVGFFLNIFS